MPVSRSCSICSSSRRRSSHRSFRTSFRAVSNSAWGWRERWPPSPNILLMDEPFGALDAIIRGRAQDDLLAIQRRFKTTIVLVTHDMEEAFRLGNRIAVLSHGNLLQYAEPAAIVLDPADAFVARLTGAADRAYRLLSLATARDALERGTAEGPDIHPTPRCARCWLDWCGQGRTPCRSPLTARRSAA